MDSADLLDLLGNENRRRILRLLSRKPCYVTEIGEYLGVSPKAVIDHLRKLEAAGLIESRTDERQRKYFSIARNVRLEVNLSPYEFGTKSAYSASKNLDLGGCRYLSVEITPHETSEMRELASELEELQELQNELSMAQRWVQARLTDVVGDIAESLDAEDARLHTAILRVLANRPRDVRTIAARVDAPPEYVAEALESLAEEGIVEQDGAQWRLRA
jgi:ArsR family transcriptional regulator